MYRYLHQKCQQTLKIDWSTRVLLTSTDNARVLKTQYHRPCSLETCYHGLVSGSIRHAPFRRKVRFGVARAVHCSETCRKCCITCVSPHTVRSWAMAEGGTYLVHASKPAGPSAWKTQGNFSFINKSMRLVHSLITSHFEDRYRICWKLRRSNCRLAWSVEIVRGFGSGSV